METYRVRIDKDSMVFSAAHFITYSGDVCERLHGHNYRVGVEVEGALDENAYVVDFIALCDALREVLDELDHRVLLPLSHQLIRVEAGAEEVEVRFAERRWVFPRCDCLLMDVPNTTAEMFARHIGRRLAEAVRARCGTELRTIRVEVDECFGQLAIYELRGAETDAANRHRTD